MSPTGSLLKRFPCLFGFCLLVSSVPNFRPDTGGRRWPLIQIASSVLLSGGTGAAFPSMLLRLPAALYGACPVLRTVPALGFCTKALIWLRLRFVPSPPELLRQPGACRAHSPRVRRAFCPPRPRWCTFSPPCPQPQSPPAPVRCLCPVSHHDCPESQEVFG